jgi:hydrogenase expression/formation protein HypD
MEICGGQTHTLLRSGIDRMLPDGSTLVHGPGCPVCVTPLELIDRALAIARRPEVIFTSFGDMLRVPGSTTDLLAVKAEGGDVRIVYSPLDAVKLAQKHPDRQVVFFAVGFETTAPANAMAVWQARQLGLDNFSLLVSHVLVPPAMEAILASPQPRAGVPRRRPRLRRHGLLGVRAAGERYRVPIVVTGFEPLDLLHGILMAVAHARGGAHRRREPVRRAVRRDGNRPAQQLSTEVFEVCDRKWRGIGDDPASGWPCGPSTPPSTPRSASPSTPSPPTSPAVHRRRDPAGPEEAAPSAPPSAGAAPRSGRSARRWSRPRAPAPPTTATRSVDPAFGGSCPLPLADYPTCRWRTAAAASCRSSSSPGCSCRVRQPRAGALHDGAVFDDRRRAGSPSPPTPTSCGRSSSPAATSARWRCTARSTTSPCAARSRSPSPAASSSRRDCRWRSWPASSSRCAAAAAAAGVSIVTGDTKVVDRGKGDGIYVNTAGVGLVPDGIDIDPVAARPGDAVILSGGSPTTASPSCRCARGSSSRA